MVKMMKLKFLALIILVSVSFNAIAASDIPLSLSYPELEVTPLASKRLEIEAKKEKRSLRPYIPMFVSGFFVSAAAFSSLNTQEKNGHSRPVRGAAALIGVSTMAYSAYLSANYQPYKKGQREIKGLPTSTKREQLIRERMAESSLSQASRRAKITRWISSLSIIASGYAIGNTIPKQDGSSDNAHKVFAYISGATGLLNLFLPTHWERVWSEQKSYKRKIYGPITTIIPIKNGAGLNLAWNF